MTDDERLLLGDMFTMREAEQIEQIYMARKLAMQRERRRYCEDYERRLKKSRGLSRTASLLIAAIGGIVISTGVWMVIR